MNATSPPPPPSSSEPLVPPSFTLPSAILPPTQNWKFEKERRNRSKRLHVYDIIGVIIIELACNARVYTHVRAIYGRIATVAGRVPAMPTAFASCVCLLRLPPAFAFTCINSGPRSVKRRRLSAPLPAPLLVRRGWIRASDRYFWFVHAPLIFILIDGSNVFHWLATKPTNTFTWMSKMDGLWGRRTGGGEN